MKKLLLLTAFLAVALFSGAAAGLRVKPLAGDAVTFHFDSKPEITFLGGKLQVKTTGSPAVTFELDDIDSIDFADAAGIDRVAAGDLTMSADAAGVHFTNIADGAMVSVYSLSGQAVVAPVVCDGGEFHLLRADVGQGVYIVKIADFVTKVIL